MIPYAKPSISQLEIDYCLDAVTNGWGPRCYEYIDKFEKSFSSYLNSTYSHATSSCTGALVLALRSLGVGPGDEVITSDLNWVAAVSAIKTVGATPVCVDIEMSTWCISPTAAEAAITKKTKAILVTHIYGNMASIDELLQVSKSYSIPVVEDAAEALGTELRGRKAGSFGDIGVFSFHGTKTMTTGEGGMLVTSNEEIYNSVLQLNNHGRSAKSHQMFWSDVWGYKFKISNIQAAIGLGQVERLDALVQRKREIFEAYRQNLQGSNLSLNPQRADERNSYWMPTVIFENPESKDLRNAALDAYKRKGIDARPVFWKLSDFSFVKKSFENPIATHVSRSGINLPSFHEITNDQIETVSAITLEVASELNK